MFNKQGHVVDAVYYNHLVSCDTSVQHSGDNRTGEGEGDDEQLVIELEKVGRNIHALVVLISSYTAQPFWKVETAHARVLELRNSSPLLSVSVGCAGKHTSFLLCMFHRDPRRDNCWLVSGIRKPTPARTIPEVVPQIQQHLKSTILPDIELSKERAIKFSIQVTKGQSFHLNTARVHAVTMGLGWDMVGKAIDLDASCCQFDRDGNMLDVVYYGQLKNGNGSICHTGDNLTGAGEGDDEQINVDLHRLPPECKSLVFTVNCYSGLAFSSVKNAYVRMMENIRPGGNLNRKREGTEIVRFELAQGYGTHTALVLCVLSRNEDSNNTWSFTALGEPAFGRTYRDIRGDMLHHLHKLGLSSRSGERTRSQVSAMAPQIAAVVAVVLVALALAYFLL
eukprot:TRINITY_DN8453_c0_g1_i1.p1 TRINITY_DN8453_c0_g1~~TRINITY_DN8453_c0_g1_i1.p1  ORF type:complete len:425 (+),score=137.32 TRINITY_DN8453_c0_g1_i1:96-1277(+)